jgi:CheY-like chemotaxis protein
MHFALSGTEALDRRAEEIRPALVAVLSDINMPGMDGLQLLGEIKQHFPDRKGFDGLSALVQEKLAQDPFCGHPFVFRGHGPSAHET